MSKILAVLKREFIETVRTKAFAITTVLVPVFMGAMLFLPQLLARTTRDAAIRLAVHDGTGRLFGHLDRELASDPEGDFLGNGGRRYLVIEAQGPLEDPVSEVARLDAYALIDIDQGVIEGAPEVIYYSENVSDRDPVRRVARALDRVLPRVRLEGTDLTLEQIDTLTAGVTIETMKISEGGEVQKRGFEQEWMLPMTLCVWLYVSTLMAGMALSRSLLEEKANRVVEVLVSSVTPMELMAGKILGQALVILTQFGVWILMGAALYLRGASSGSAMGAFSAIDAKLLIFLGIYFILGYFLYAALFAGVGAICTTEMEAQQMQTPVVLLVVVPMVVAIAIVRQPDSAMAVTLSMIPFFSPSVMMMRMALHPPGGVQIFLSIAILCVTILASTWAVSKVFRVGILMTGKRMTLPEMVRWLRAS